VPTAIQSRACIAPERNRLAGLDLEHAAVTRTFDRRGSVVEVALGERTPLVGALVAERVQVRLDVGDGHATGIGVVGPHLSLGDLTERPDPNEVHRRLLVMRA
jgi:hypothetical protein